MITPDERRALAQSIKDNPLTEAILSEIEHDAIERCINAPLADDETRKIASMEVRVAREFRRKLEDALQDNPKRRQAPA